MEPTEIDILFFKEKEDVILSFILFNQQIPRKDQNQQHVGAIHYILKCYIFFTYLLISLADVVLHTSDIYNYYQICLMRKLTVLST